MHHRIIPFMDRHAWTASVIGMVALVCALLLVAGVALAAPPLLPQSAFQAPSTCTVEPFADPSAEQREQRLARDCAGDDLQMRVNTPRVRAIDTGPSRVELDVDKLVTLHTDSFTASARLGWGGASDEAQPRLSTNRALIAAGGLLRLDEEFALDLSVGHDLGPGQRSRATATALYRPAGRNLLFVQVASEADGFAPAIGMRWWVSPRRASFDVMARRSADGQSFEPRLGFQIFGR